MFIAFITKDITVSNDWWFGDNYVLGRWFDDILRRLSIDLLQTFVSKLLNLQADVFHKVIFLINLFLKFIDDSIDWRIINIFLQNILLVNKSWHLTYDHLLWFNQLFVSLVVFIRLFKKLNQCFVSLIHSWEILKDIWYCFLLDAKEIFNPSIFIFNSNLHLFMDLLRVLLQFCFVNHDIQLSIHELSSAYVIFHSFPDILQCSFGPF